MIGDVKSRATITGGVIASASVQGHVNASCVVGAINLGKVVTMDCQHQRYDGDYYVTPTPDGFFLDTDGKLMRYDLRVNPIPFYKTSNLSGGYTVNIGG